MDIISVFLSLLLPLLFAGVVAILGTLCTGRKTPEDSSAEQEEKKRKGDNIKCRLCFVK